jgi:penicillin-binding protein 2
VTRRSLRHPLRGRRRYARRPASAPRRGLLDRLRSGRAPQLRLRPRRNVNVATLVASPEEVPSRPRLRLRVVGAVAFVLFAVMALRLWDLQVIGHRQYAAAVNANRIREVTVPAPRGLIVDRSDTVLAGNRVENQVVLSRAEAHSDPGIVGRVAALVGVPPAAVQAALTDQQYSPYEPVPVLKNAPAAIVQYLDAHESQFPGVTVVPVTVRDYPQGGSLANQVLGYVGPINGTELKAHAGKGYTESSQIGKTGVEAEDEGYLRGKVGRQTLEVTPTGTVVGTLHETKPTQGDTAVLNLTADLQKYVQSALATDITNDRQTPTKGVYPSAPNGAAVVMDVETGAVLALASYPSYSLTEWVGGISTANYEALQSGCSAVVTSCPLDDYAIQGLYTPGSTFKLATATAALQDGLITPTSSVDDTGVFDVRTHGDPTCTSGCTFHDATAADAGIVDVSSALTRSDDYFFYTLGWRFFENQSRYGPAPIQKTANELGLGGLTGIDLPGEAQGRVDSQAVREKLHQATPTGFPNDFWYPGTNIEMAFGQGETIVTPIEEAQAYATFADHGVKHQPEVLGAVVTPSGNVVQRVQPVETGHVTYSGSNYQAMLDGFIGVTHTPSGTAYGTFQQFSHVPSTYVIAGKTGTATTATSTRQPPNAWFVGFGPVNGTTQYVVAVAVAKAGYGASAAAPAVANIFNYLYANPPRALTLPTAASQPSASLPPANPPAGTPTTTTTTPTTAPTSTTVPQGTTAAPSSGGAAAAPAANGRPAVTTAAVTTTPAYRRQHRATVRPRAIRAPP